MELTNEFTVGVPVEQAWALLNDVERIAPCLPGAQLQEIEGEEYRGIVKVKVGPITAQYKGKANFVERDDASHRSVLRAEGRDTRGQGNANATITATMEPDGDGTKVKVVTDLAVTGKVAQFGRGVMADISAKLLGQFVECLEKDVLATLPAASAAAGAEAPASDAELAAVAPAGTSAAVTGAGEVVAGAPSTGSPGPAGLTTGTTTTAAGGANGDGRATATAPTPGVRKVDQAPTEAVDLLEAAGAPVAKRAVPAAIGVVAAILAVLWLRRRR